MRTHISELHTQVYPNQIWLISFQAAKFFLNKTCPFVVQTGLFCVLWEGHSCLQNDKFAILCLFLCNMENTFGHVPYHICPMVSWATAHIHIA